MKQKILSVIQSVAEHLNSDDFKSSNRLDEHNFVRQRSLPFVSVVVIIINNISKSLNVELSKFFIHIKSKLEATKQAFSKARYKMKWESFVELNDVLITAYYKTGDYQLFKGKYLLMATDGSDYELPYEKPLITEFGVADNGITKQPICMAKGVKIWDIMNKMTISSFIGHYDIAEINHFKTAWQHAKDLLENRIKGQLLLLGDMHYPSFWLIHDLCTSGVKFAFRCPPTFCREVIAFMKSSEKDAILTIAIGTDTARKCTFKRQTGLKEIPQCLRIRAIKFTQATGEEGCIITDLTVEELSYDELCDLYGLRWGIEVSYDFDKNRMEIENFSAKLPQGVRQDWYANTFTSNMAQLIIDEAQELLDMELKGKDNKYDYQINRSVALGLIKDEIPKMLLGIEKPITFYNRMVNSIKKFREPIRPNRSYPREKKHKIKFSMNLRRVV